jgi:hypothetical protein
MPAFSQMAVTPLRMPSELSCGVDGVLLRQNAPVLWLKSKRSVNVPPTSTPNL